MTARQAFQRRDWYTCTACFHYRVGEDGRPYCATYGPIRYDPHRYGCGEFGVRSSVPRERETLYTFGGGSTGRRCQGFRPAHRRGE